MRLEADSPALVGKAALSGVGLMLAGVGGEHFPAFGLASWALAHGSPKSMWLWLSKPFWDPILG